MNGESVKDETIVNKAGDITHLPVNNEKKRFGRRAGFGIAAVALITLFTYISMFKFSDPEIGLKWVIIYSAITGGICCLVGGLLTLTDIKTLAKIGLKK